MGALTVLAQALAVVCRQHGHDAAPARCRRRRAGVRRSRRRTRPRHRRLHGRPGAVRPAPRTGREGRSSAPRRTRARGARAIQAAAAAVVRSARRSRRSGGPSGSASSKRWKPRSIPNARASGNPLTNAPVAYPPPRSVSARVAGPAGRGWPLSRAPWRRGASAGHDRRVRGQRHRRGRDPRAEAETLAGQRVDRGRPVAAGHPTERVGPQRVDRDQQDVRPLGRGRNREGEADDQSQHGHAAIQPRRRKKEGARRRPLPCVAARSTRP